MQLISLIAKKWKSKCKIWYEKVSGHTDTNTFCLTLTWRAPSTLHWPSANFCFFLLCFYISARVQLIFDYAICHTEAITFHLGNLMRHPRSLGNLRSEWHRWQQHSSGSSSSSAREEAAPPALSIISEVALVTHSWSLWHHRAGKHQKQWSLKTVAFVYIWQTFELLEYGFNHALG